MLFFYPVTSGHKDLVEASLSQVTRRDHSSNQDNASNRNLMKEYNHGHSFT